MKINFKKIMTKNKDIKKEEQLVDNELENVASQETTAEQVAQIEAKVNEVIAMGLDVTIGFVTREQAAEIVDLSKLPEDASDTLRIVRIGDYDACACIGAHVQNTREVGTFKVISHSYENGVWRLRWKVIL